MWTRHLLKYLAIGFACTTMLSGCPRDLQILGLAVLVIGIPDDEVKDCTIVIDSGSDAQYIANWISYSIADEVEGLPSGNYLNELVFGARGEMLISGTIDHSYSSNEFNDHAVTVTMTNYASFPQKRQSFSGDVNFSDRNNIVTVTDNGSMISILIDDPNLPESVCDNDASNIADTIISLSSSAESDDLFNQYGYLTTENGTFNF